jgi:hypothetical protein
VRSTYLVSLALALTLHVVGLASWVSSAIKPVFSAPVTQIRTIQISAVAAQNGGGLANENPAAVTKSPAPIHKSEPSQPIERPAPSPPPLNRVAKRTKPPQDHRAQDTQPPAVAATESGQKESPLPAPLTASKPAANMGLAAAAPSSQSLDDSHLGSASLSGVAAGKPRLGSICTAMIKPETPATESSFKAWLTVQYKIDDGRVTRVDLMNEKYSVPVDQKTRKDFLSAIQVSAAKYVCQGNYLGVVQDFYFDIKESE